MLFHSIDFFIFFSIIFPLYYFLSKNNKTILLFAASYIFYGMWNYKFLLLILSSTMIDFYCGKKISSASDNRKRKFFLLLSISANLGLLAFFKYSFFILENINYCFSLFNFQLSFSSLKIILPIGISFYTFQSMSYTIDIYRKELDPEPSFTKFALYVSFFPQLIAGPIERASRFLPLIHKEKKFRLDNICEGVSLFLWGLFQKIVIADNMAIVSDWVFEHHSINHNGWLVLAAIYAFSFQILADFSGYTDMARGIAKLFDYELSINFRAPYFSASPSEFWTRWHISLSSWLRDYLYIPLGGNRGNKVSVFSNLLITMFLGGLWHGASWNFVLWGVYHGLLLILYRLLSSFIRLPKNIFFKLSGIIIFYHLTCLGWVFFRCDSISQISKLLKAILFNFNLNIIQPFTTPFFSLILIYLLFQFIQYKKKEYNFISFKNPLLNTALHIALFYFIIFIGVFKRQEFIYFQF